MGRAGQASQLSDDKPAWREDGARRHSPAVARNKDVIADTLAGELPSTGLVLEIAAGSGEHALHFAQRFRDLQWLPTDPSPESIASILAWKSDYSGSNLLAPLQLDAASTNWPVSEADAIVCINMVHIAPFEATAGLFAGATRLLGSAAPLILYGPYFEPDVEPAASNLAFHESLQSRDPRWGIRNIEAIDEIAHGSGFRRSARYAMPANNLTLVYRKN